MQLKRLRYVGVFQRGDRANAFQAIDCPGCRDCWNQEVKLVLVEGAGVTILYQKTS